jgi:hypothetical protein
MKIAIYGDSFGAGFAFKMSKKAQSSLSYIGDDWTEILASKFNVTNFSEFSSSLVFSVNKFEQTHSQFDKIIFLVTHPGRVTMGNPNIYQPTPHFVNYEFSKLWADRAKEENWTTELNSVLNYYLYIYDESHVTTTHLSLVNYIKTLRHDTIMIPNFNNSYSNISGGTLTDIFEKENKHWGVKYPIFEYDMRKCHMVRENNEILSHKMERWINGEAVLIDTNDFVVPPLSKEKYIFKEKP